MDELEIESGETATGVCELCCADELAPTMTSSGTISLNIELPQIFGPQIFQIFLEL